jgi:hypothetical protein
MSYSAPTLSFGLDKIESAMQGIDPGIDGKYWKI